MMLNKLLFGIKIATLVPNKTQASGLKGRGFFCFVRL